jgi:P27 family predicted phage terminase small subunit
LRGDRPSRLAPHAPKATGAPATAPHLGVVAREEWGRIVAELDRAGVLAQTDRSVLALYCVTYSQWLQARALVAQHGMLVPTPDGGLKANPAVGIAGALGRLMLQCLTELGATSAARGRVQSGVEEGPDALAAFLRTRKRP